MNIDQAGEESAPAEEFKAMIKFLLWCILLVLCWPPALVARWYSFRWCGCCWCPFAWWGNRMTFIEVDRLTRAITPNLLSRTVEVGGAHA